MSPQTGMSRHSASVDHFAGLAARELDSLNSLISLLDEERSALTQGDAEVLPELIANKTGHIQALAQLAAERAHVLADASVKMEGAEIRSFLAGHQPATETWERLLAAARKAAGLNTANAFLTSTRLTSVSRALAVLAGPQPDLYDPRGANARPPAVSRSLFRG